MSSTKSEVMKLFKITLIAVIILCTNTLQAQDQQDTLATDTAKKHLPITYNLGIGLFNYRGDVGFIKGLGTTENLQAALNIGADYKFHNAFSAGINLGYGSLVKNEINNSSRRNFKTSVLTAGVRGTFHFANGFILAENYPIDPFIAVGFDLIAFNPKSDLEDEEGQLYFYWPDGSVRDVPFTVNTSGNTLLRDYDYETELLADESKTAFAIPITLGFNLKITPYLSAQIAQSVSFTTTDVLDGFEAGQAKDLFMYSQVGVKFNPAALGKRTKKNKEYENIDFVALLKADGDADGILDIDDRCNDTEEGIKVDKFGCPLDEDNDGIPNHLDQEINTKPEIAAIDTNGVGIPDSIIAIQAADTIVTLREELCEFYPSMCQGDETDIEFQLINVGKADRSLLSSKVEPSKKPIEEIKKLCDLNADGKVSSKEIYESIDAYFDGKLAMDLGDIHKLIDYYFEQE